MPTVQHPVGRAQGGAAQVTTLNVPIAANVDGDLIVIAWQRMANNTTQPTATGFSPGIAVNSGWSSSGLIYKKNSGGATASPVTVTFPAASDATVQSYVIRGTAASPIGNTATSATEAAARVTTSAANSLVISSAGARLSSPPMPINSAVFCPMATGFMNQEVGGVSGVEAVATSGAQSSAFTWKCYTSANQSSCAMEIKSDGTSMPIQVASGRTVIDYNTWNDTARTWYKPSDATINIASIDGVNMSTYDGAIGYNARLASGGGLWSRRAIYYLTGTSTWEGKWMSCSVDLTGKVLCIPWARNRAQDDRIGNRGLIYVLVDQNKNYVAYKLRNVGDLFVGGVWYTKYIKYGVTTAFATGQGTGGSGSFDIAAIRFLGFFAEGTTGQSNGECYLYLGPVWMQDSPTIFTGGSATDPLDLRRIYQQLNADQMWLEIAKLQGTRQYLSGIKHQLGDGTNKAVAKLAGESFAFRAVDVDYALAAGDSELRLKGSASCSLDLSAAIVVGETKQSLVIDASASTSGTYLMAGMSVINNDATWKTGVAGVGAVFSGSHAVDGKAQKFDACTFINSALTSGAHLLLDGGADTNNKSGAINSAFTKGGETYAVELRTAGFYDITDTTFSGYTNELYISGAAGTYTIKLAVGQTQPDVYNPNSRTIVWDVPTVDVTFGPLEAGSQVVVFAQGTTTEMFRDDNSATSEVWTGASGAYDYTIMKAGMLPVRGSGAAPTASITIAPQQKVDWAYVASSGLVFADLAFDFGSKYLKCNVATTIQNLHSFLIESWIAQTSLRNKDFIMSPNGPNGFGLLDGWETRGFTTAGTGIANTTLSNLTRDGLRYLTGTTETAVWAALLTSGVPAGKQVRYQQSDAGATVNATNTGNMDQLVQTYGDATHGNFDKRGYLVLKVQADGYDQAETDVFALYGTLGAQLFSVGLTPLANGIATGDPALTITITQGTYVVDGKTFSVKIVDNATPSSGTDILRELRYNFAAGGAYQGEDAFNWHDLVQKNGDNFKTVRGTVYGAAATKGVLVYKADGTTLHPDFTLFTADNGTTYAPVIPVTLTIGADVSLAGAAIYVYDMDNSPAGSYGTALGGTASSAGATFDIALTAANQVWVQIFKTGYVEWGGSVTMPSVSTSLTATLDVDENAA